VLEQQEDEPANDPTAEAEVPDLEADERGAEDEADDEADANVDADADADPDADAEADDADEDSVTAAAALALPEDEDEEQYHQVGGAEAAALEDEDDYADVLAPPNDGGTADHSELDAADVHANADGETDEPGGDTLPTEYEDYAGYVEDDVERAEDELDDPSEVAGLGEVESGVGITGDEKDEQAVWEAAADTIIPTFTPKEMARAAASRTTDKSEHGGSGAHTGTLSQCQWGTHCLTSIPQRQPRALISTTTALLITLTLTMTKLLGPVLTVLKRQVSLALLLLC
jgi:hypothetical protein